MAYRDDVLAAQDLNPVPVEVPEWPGRIFVRAMTGTERFKLEGHSGDSGEKIQGSLDFMLRVIVLCSCDASGNPVFTEADMPALGGKNSVLLMRIFRKAAELNALTPADIKDLEKNSDGARDEDSSSD